MNITLPGLLLVFGGLTFWLLTESSIKWYLKTACITAFCLFTMIFWTTIHTFLGWPALEDDMPETVLIHWVVIKEPNKNTAFSGAIYFLLESADRKNTSFFGYRNSRLEPRLFGVPYNRELHEKVEKQMMGKLRRGQPVIGKFKQAGDGEDSTEAGKGKGVKGRKGKGDESQEQHLEFHELLPSQIHRKPE